MLTGESQFDGYDPVTFEHTDTLDESRNRLAAGRLWGDFGGDSSPWSGRVSASLLDSSNRNFLAAVRLYGTGPEFFDQTLRPDDLVTLR